jgi:hypothetical protein
MKRKKPNNLFISQPHSEIIDIDKSVRFEDRECENRDMSEQCTADNKCPDKSHKNLGLFAAGHHSKDDEELIPILNHILLILTTKTQEFSYICKYCSDATALPYDLAKRHARDTHGSMLGLTFSRATIYKSIQTIMSERKKYGEQLTYNCIYN